MRDSSKRWSWHPFRIDKGQILAGYGDLCEAPSEEGPLYIYVGSGHSGWRSKFRGTPRDKEGHIGLQRSNWPIVGQICGCGGDREGRTLRNSRE